MKYSERIRLYFWVLPLFLSSGNLVAQPVIESLDRFELNWSTMRIRFYGEAMAEFSGKGFAGAEKAAVEDGVLYALTSIANVRSGKGLAPGYKNLANDLTKHAYVYNMTYFGDGKVRADLEGNLVRALDLGIQNFHSEEPQSEPSEGTSILINVNGLKGPRMLSSIYSEEGELLHDGSYVSKSAFRKNGLGRWFFRNSSEVKTFSGTNPISLDGTFAGGRLVVKKEAWEEVKKNHPRLIEESKVAYILPGGLRTSSKIEEKRAM
jgi:hypothetical protein